MDQITSAATESDTSDSTTSTTSTTLDHSQRRFIELGTASKPFEMHGSRRNGLLLPAELSSPGLSTLGRCPSRAQNFSLCFEFKVQECVDVLTKQLAVAAAPQNHHNVDDDGAAGTALLFWDAC